MIHHNTPCIEREDEEAVAAVLSSRWLAPGPEVAALETAFTRLLNGGSACAVSSGTAALYLALISLGIGRGERVAVPTYACSALLDAVHLAGASPLVIDTGDDLNLDPDSLDRRSRRARARATIVVHTYGAPARVEDIMSVGGQVVEDCCHALGGEDRGRPLGSVGHAAVFSFYATKVVAGGHGGLVWSRDPAVVASIRRYIEPPGPSRRPWAPGFNLRTSDLHAALARSQLSRLPRFIARRREIARRYLEAVPPGLEASAEVISCGRLVYRFLVRARDEPTRERLRQYFLATGIEVSPLLCRHELLHRLLGLRVDDFPMAERLVGRILSLPLYPALSEAEVEAVCSALSRAPV